MKRWRQIGQKDKRRSLAQVALEYILTTLTLAMIASLLYLIYQPVVYSVFAPVHLKNLETGLEQRDHGLGLKQMQYLPIP